jgi:hypothetical protein
MTEKRNVTILDQICVSLYFTLLGYCLGRQLIAFYYAVLALKKARRDLDNSYMNLITSIKENPLDDLV